MTLACKPTEACSGGAVRLATARLVLRAPEIGDLADLVRLADNRAVAAMLARMPHPYGEAEGRAFIEAIAPAGNGRIFAIELGETGRFIGCAGMEGKGAVGELGYWLGEPHWGKGYATEAAQALVDYGFASLGLARVDAWRRLANRASRAVLHKCGFQYDGQDMRDTLLAGRVAMERYRLDRRVWAGLKSWGK